MVSFVTGGMWNAVLLLSLRNRRTRLASISCATGKSGREGLLCVRTLVSKVSEWIPRSLQVVCYDKVGTTVCEVHIFSQARYVVMRRRMWCTLRIVQSVLYFRWHSYCSISFVQPSSRSSLWLQFLTLFRVLYVLKSSAWNMTYTTRSNPTSCDRCRTWNAADILVFFGLWGIRRSGFTPSNCVPPYERTCQGR